MPGLGEKIEPNNAGKSILPLLGAKNREPVPGPPHPQKEALLLPGLFS